MRTLSMPLAILWAALTAAVPAQEGAAKPDPNKEDLKKLQGKWKPVSYEQDGKKQNIGDLESWLIRGQVLELLEVNGNLFGKMEIRIDATKTPKELDIILLGEGKLTLLSIYSLDGDDLKVCLPNTNKRDRPRDFATQPKQSVTLRVYKRCTE